MTTGEWGTGSPSAGEQGAEGRGTVGTDAPTTPMGSALPIVQFSTAMLTLLCVVLVIARMKADAVLLIGTITLAVCIWATLRMRGRS